MIVLFFQLFHKSTDMPCAGSTEVAKDGRGPRAEYHVFKRMVGNHGTRRIMKTLGISLATAKVTLCYLCPMTVGRGLIEGSRI